MHAPVRSQRNLIFVELEREATPSAVTRAVPPSAPVAAAAADAGKALARNLRAVRTEYTTTGTSVVLVGDGRLVAKNIESAGSRRVYLDFAGVSPNVAPVTQVGKGGIERIRVGLNSRDPLVTRVVIDLNREAAHALSTTPGDWREVRVNFSSGAQGGQDVPRPRRRERASARRVRRFDGIGARRGRRRQRASTGAPGASRRRGGRSGGAACGPGTCRAPGTQRACRGACAGQDNQRLSLWQRPFPGRSSTPGHPISLDFQGADLRAVLRTFAEISGLNIVIDPAVQGSVDVSLRDVPWDQALDIILRANKLGYSVDGTIVRVAPLNVLADEEKQRRSSDRGPGPGGRTARHDDDAQLCHRGSAEGRCS